MSRTARAATWPELLLPVAIVGLALGLSELHRQDRLDTLEKEVFRKPDGRWWVMSDRTQIPTGAGYALANRLVGILHG